MSKLEMNAPKCSSADRNGVFRSSDESPRPCDTPAAKLPVPAFRCFNAEIKNVLAIGDSVLQGVSVKDGQVHINPRRFTGLIEEKMHIAVNNKARLGSTVAYLGQFTERFEETLRNPELDTVFLLFGGNDSDFDWKAISENPSGTHLCKTLPDEFVRQYLNGINTLKALGKQIFLFSLPPIVPDRYFSCIGKGKNSAAILSWLQNDVSLISHWHEMFNLAVFRIGAEANVPTVDITSCFLSAPNYGRFFCEDGIHPNTEGHRLIADAVTLQLVPGLTC